MKLALSVGLLTFTGLYVLDYASVEQLQAAILGLILIALLEVFRGGK